MQDYREFAEKNGVTLQDHGSCQFCGSQAEGGVHECIEIFSIGFQELDLNAIQNHVYRFLIVDAHALQHPELHGRWSNHFHLTRLHLIFQHNVPWTYELSPLLSDHLNRYKKGRPKEILKAPLVGERGDINAASVKQVSNNAEKCKLIIEEWARSVYVAWSTQHELVDPIAQIFLKDRR
jgi:hypothetical protein